MWGFDIDENSRAARCAIGVVPQEINIDPFFTPRELLELQAGLYGVRRRERRTDEILAAVGLSDQADSYARALSGGMRRRLLVAKAMVHTPPVLVLDEPTAGVDIELRQQFWSYVGGLNADGTTILLTTHYLEEAERFCDAIAIIDEGRLAACDTTSALVRRSTARPSRCPSPRTSRRYRRRSSTSTLRCCSCGGSPFTTARARRRSARFSPRWQPPASP